MKNTLLITFTAAIFFSCKKDATIPQETPYYQMSQELLDYVKLNERHYYIYQDSATNSLDSVIVTQSTFTKKKLFDNTNQGCSGFFCIRQKFNYDLFELTMKKTDILHKQEIWLAAKTMGEIGATNFLASDSAETMLQHPFVSSGLLKIYTIPSLIIEGISYNNVLVCDEDSSNFFYWVKGLGFIKRSLKGFYGNRRTWTLVRHGQL